MFRFVGITIVAAAVAGFAPASQDGFFESMQVAEQLHVRGEYAAAEKLLLEAVKEADSLGPEDPRKAVALNNLGSSHHHMDRYLEAERCYRRAIEICRTVCGDVLLARFTANLVDLYLETRQYAKAERLGLASLAKRLEASSPNDPDLGRLVVLLGTLAAEQGRYSEAERYYRQALASREEVEPDSVDAFQALNNLGTVYAKTGRIAEALSCFERALPMTEKMPGPVQYRRARLLANFATLQLNLRGPAEAEPYYRSALAVAESTLGPNHRLVGQILSAYAVVLHKTKRKAQAKEFERRASAILRARSREDPGWHTVDIGDLQRQSGKR